MQLKIHRGLAADNDLSLRSLRGTFAGVIAPALIPRTAIETLLPPNSGLRLGSMHEHRDDYPVVILFGRQKLVRNYFHGLELTLGFGREYSELVLVIPDLELPETHEYSRLPRVTFYSQLYLNSFWSVLLGRSLYGFSKHLARFDEQDDRFSAASLFGKPLFEARANTTSGRIDSDRIDTLREQFSDPVVFQQGRHLVVRKFQYQFNERRIVPVRTELTLHSHLAPRFPETDLTMDGLDRNDRGAIRCKIPWVMTNYLPAAERVAAPFAASPRYLHPVCMK